MLSKYIKEMHRVTGVALALCVPVMSLAAALWVDS